MNSIHDLAKPGATWALARAIGPGIKTDKNHVINKSLRLRVPASNFTN